MSRRDRKDETLLLRPDPRTARSGNLLIAVGTPGEQRFPVGTTPIVIGKDPTAHIVLTDPAVSRRHCEVKRTAAGVHIQDLGSRNGTFVGGVAMERGLLSHGSTIRVGETDIHFLSEEDEAASRVESGPTRFGMAVGVSPVMRKLFALLERLAATDLSITLIGETGTGKDILARAIHSCSNRKDKSFVVFDAGAVAATLIESRLFGHMKGAFTGAVSDQQGQFEAANSGTLFLDEIGELNLELQPKLLRALEQRTVVRLGGTAEIPVDVRIVAATNRDLASEVAAGRFREDLFFRLGVAVAMGHRHADHLSHGVVGREQRVRAFHAKVHIVAPESETRVSDQRPREESRLTEHLEPVADPQDGATLVGKGDHVLHDGAHAGDGAGAKVVAVGETPGQEDGVVPVQPAIPMPDEAGRPVHLLDGLVEIVVAVGSRERHHRDLHDAAPSRVPTTETS